MLAPEPNGHIEPTYTQEIPEIVEPLQPPAWLKRRPIASYYTATSTARAGELPGFLTNRNVGKGLAQTRRGAYL